MSGVRLRSFPLYGAMIDLILFCASFAFFGGAHGPTGPMYVLHVMNAPVAKLGSWLLSERSSTAFDLMFAFGEVALNGALYGLAVALVVASWRAIFRRGRST
jgi:hypothetical protein